jgi:hypothetical protein
MKNNKNIILLVIAGAGAFYLFNRMKKKPEQQTNIKTKQKPKDPIDLAAQKVKNVKKDVSRVKAIAKKYVNPQNVKKALNFIKKVKPTNTRIKKK